MKNLLFATLTLFLLTGCEEHIPEKNIEPENSEQTIVEITNEQMKAAGIKLGGFQKRKMKNRVKANGILELPPQNKANISPLMGGTVKDILVIEGDFVEEGQPLIQLQHPEFIQLQQDFLEAVNMQSYLEAEYERKKNLYNENISSSKEFQQVEMEYKTNESKVKAIRAKLQLLNLDVAKIENGEIQSFISIKSPIHGYVRRVETSIGVYVAPNEQIIEILDNHHIHIDLLVYENDINKIKVDQFVNFKIAGLKNVEHQAKVFAVGKAFENDLKAVRVHAEIENPDENLLPGMYVDASILTDEFESNTLPESALLREGENNYIFINDNSEHEDEEEDHHTSFRKIEVKLGIIDNGFAEVTPFEDIDQNAAVVLQGSYYLDAELNKGDGGHHH